THPRHLPRVPFSFSTPGSALHPHPHSCPTRPSSDLMTSFTTSAAQTISNLAAGTSYSFSEGTLPAGPNGTQWQQVSLACSDGSSQLGPRFTLQPPNNIACTPTTKIVHQARHTDILQS